ncbi:MAG TPA: S9 family peptidase [Vicinamibacterales bacterium]|nr:S9 family peptidase [Vicinamibacterales bacterium]
MRLLLTLLVLVTAPAQEQTRRPMTVDDALDLKNVGNALISPDGRSVFYSVSELDWAGNKRNTKYYLVPAEGGEPYEYLGKDGGASFQFSPDGRYFTFTRPVDDKAQLFWMRTTGGEATPLFTHETAISEYKWSADSAKIFFRATDKRPDAEQKAIDAKDDAIFVDEGPNGQAAAYWSNLWVFDIATRKATRITSEPFIVSDFDPSPDGTRVAFVARTTNRRNDADRNEIYVVTVADGLKTQLTDNRAPESGLLWAPGGEVFLFTAADDRAWLNRNPKIYVMDPNTRTHRLVSGEYEGGISNPIWTPDGRAILFNGQQGVDTHLFRLDITTGTFSKLTDTPGTFNASSYSNDRSKLVYTATDFDTPGDLWVSAVEPFRPVRLTNVNPHTESSFALASMRVVRWKSKGGMEIEGLLHLPIGYVEGARVPLMLNIHGGPAGSWRNTFAPMYHVYAGLGYASLSPNVRGSSGYTDRLREGNTVERGDGIGYGDYEDLVTGVDMLIEQGIADPDRLALRGWSYGGILGGWTITQTDRFKAASIGAGVYDWTSEFGPGFNNDVRLWHIGGTPWDNPDGYRKQSALTHAANVTTPTLLIHGMNDTTDTEAQSMMFFTAIKDIGKAPVRYLRFPREPHGFREPRHQRTRDIEEIRWMQKHVLGVEWTPWERGEEKKEGATAPRGRI